MFKGFYNLTSGMLTQQRNLNVVGNNLVNVSTPGFKESRYTATTFDEVMYSRTGNQRRAYTDLGQLNYIRADSAVYVNQSQGIPEPTDIPLDFAIYGDGFFAIQREDGQIAYTRSGSFSLDDEGYLCFPGQGRVLNPQGGSIHMEGRTTQGVTDKIESDGAGNIFSEQGEFLGQIGVYNFADVEQLTYDDQGMFIGDGATAVDNPSVMWKYLERSNVDMIRQMTEMLTCQRSLQSAAQVAKMYDEVMGHVASDVGRM